MRKLTTAVKTLFFGDGTRAYFRVKILAIFSLIASIWLLCPMVYQFLTGFRVHQWTMFAFVPKFASVVCIIWACFALLWQIVFLCSYQFIFVFV